MRRATWADLPWAWRLYWDSFGRYTPRWGRARAFLRFHRRLTRDGWTVELGGEPKGFGTVEVLRGRGTTVHALSVLYGRGGDAVADLWQQDLDWRRYVPGAWLTTAMAVEPGVRRRGLGAELVRARVDAARGEGARAVFVNCILGSGSEQIYESEGFSPVMEWQGYYRDGTGMRFMVLPLGEPASSPEVYVPSREARARIALRRILIEEGLPDYFAAVALLVFVAWAVSACLGLG